MDDPFKFINIMNYFGPFYQADLDEPFKCDDGRNTTSGIISFITTKYHGYINNLVEYLKCSLDLTVIMRLGNCKDFENETQVCSLSDNLGEKQMLSSKFVPILLEYDIQILSVLKYENDLSYLSFTKLFSISTWLFLFLSIIIYANLFRYLNNSNISFIECLSILLSNFVNQTSSLLTKLKEQVYMSDLTGKILLSQLFIGIICTTILSKSLTSLLLRTYYIKIPRLTVETLEEIANDHKLNVLGSEFIEQLADRKPEIYSILKEKAKKYESEFDTDFTDYKNLVNDKLIKDVINRKSVIIARSFANDMLTRFYPESNLRIGDTKFNQVFKYSFVTRSHPKSGLIYKYIIHNYEAGLTEKFFMVILNVAEIYGKVRDHKSEFTVTDQISERNPIIMDTFARGPFSAIFAGYLIGFVLLIIECSRSKIAEHRL